MIYYGIFLGVLGFRVFTFDSFILLKPFNVFLKKTHFKQKGNEVILPYTTKSFLNPKTLNLPTNSQIRVS